MSEPPVLHAVLDAARMSTMLAEAKQKNPNHKILYTGRSAQVLSDYAPYIFFFDQDTDFGDWYLSTGWGQSWGICCRTSSSANELYQHFRRFLMVQVEGHQSPIYFRFYDPRVLRRFLPTCQSEQLSAFFGPIEYFFLEDEDPDYGLYYWLEEGELVTYRVSRSDVLNDFGSGRVQIEN